MKRIFLIFSLALLAFGCASNKVEQNTVSYVYKEMSEPYVYASISYPVISGLEVLNEDIAFSVKSVYEDFKEYAEINNASDVPYELSIESQEFFNDNVASVKLMYYFYTGGNHGEVYMKTYNWDKEDRDYVSVTELSGLSLDEISDVTLSALTFSLLSSKNLEDDEIALLIANATAPKEENFENFVVRDGHLVIFFDSLQIPYSDGIPEVVIDLNK